MSNLETLVPRPPLSAGGRVRRRDALLTCLEICRDVHPYFGLADIIAFLYVCENEDLTMAELAYVSRYSVPTVSRRIRSLAEPDAPGGLEPFLGLVDFTPNPADERGRLMRLTEAGRRLRDRLDEAIATAVPIRAQPASVRR